MKDNDIRLLHKYLSKYIHNETNKDIEECQQIAFDRMQSNNLDILARSLGEVSFEFFNLYYLSDIFVPSKNNTARPLATVHFELWQDLENMFLLNTHDKEEFILPRGIGKSTIINLALTVWTHCYRKSIYTIVLANRELDATEFVSQTKKALESDKIVYAFGQLIDSKQRTVNKVECELTNDTKIQAFSSGTSIRGTKYGTVRPTLIIADDYQSEQDILTEQAKDKKYDKWLKEVEEAGEKETVRDGKIIKQATKFLVIGTPLAADCFVNRIRKNVEYKIFHRSVVNFDIDAYFENNLWWKEFQAILYDEKQLKRLEKAKLYYEQNKEIMEFETIWSKYNCFDIAKAYFVKRNQFLQELMCDCENVGQKWIKSLRQQEKEEIESNKWQKTMLTVDPATSNNSARNYDYCAFCVGSLAFNGFKYVRKGIIQKLGFNDYILKIISLLREYKDITHIYIEKNVYLGADVIKLNDYISNDKTLKARNIKIINEMQRQNKDLKISAIVDDVNSGQVIFNKEDKEFNQQIIDFTGQQTSLHDDAIDATTEFIIRIDDIEVIGEMYVTENWFTGGAKIIRPNRFVTYKEVMQ